MYLKLVLAGTTYQTTLPDYITHVNTFTYRGLQESYQCRGQFKLIVWVADGAMPTQKYGLEQMMVPSAKPSVVHCAVGDYRVEDQAPCS